MKRIAILVPFLVGLAACGDAKESAPTTTVAPTIPTTTTPPTTAAQTTVPTTAAPTTPAPVPGSLASPIPMGTAADIGQGWTLKIVAYNPNATAIVAAAHSSNLDPPEGTVFIMFSVEMTYSGDGDHAEAPPYLLLQSVALSQTTYDGFFQSFATPPEPVFNNVGEVPIGGTASGNFLQYVDPADAVGLIAFTTDPLTDTTVYFATS